jgi:biopolymer transport protein ExbD
MAMSGGKDDGSPMMEMNTTPLIDVMLVLLIMFIITIPPITNAVNIDLPTDNIDPEDPNQPDPVVNKIVIMPTNEVLWNGTPSSLDQIANLLAQTKAMSPEPELQFQPDPSAIYDTVDKTLAVVKRSGISKFGFVGNENYMTFGKASRPAN